MFAFDSVGSSGADHNCEEDYRGPYAASEPETLAMMNFVDTWTNLKFIISLHAYGNLFIIPFNYDDASNNFLRSKYPKAD